MSEPLTSNPKLLPCPFCGAEPTIKREPGWEEVWVGCMTDDCVGPYLNDIINDITWAQVAERRWNKRATPNNIPGVLVLSDLEFDAITRPADETTPAPVCSHDEVVLIAGTQCMKCEKMWISTRRAVSGLKVSESQ